MVQAVQVRFLEPHFLVERVTMPEFVPETWLGQILIEGRWVDYARGHEGPSRTWQAKERRLNPRRVVNWIDKGRKVLIPSKFDYCPVCHAAGVAPCHYNPATNLAAGVPDHEGRPR